MFASLIAALALNLFPAFATPGDAGMADAGLAMAGVPIEEPIETELAPLVAPGEPAPAAKAGPQVELTALAIGVEVSKRELLPRPERITQEVDRVYAHITVRNPGPETTLRMVWSRNGRQVQDIAVRVGESTRWRTWSYKRMQGYGAGDWTVEVIDAEGTVIGHAEFQVFEPAC